MAGSCVFFVENDNVKCLIYISKLQKMLKNYHRKDNRISNS